MYEDEGVNVFVALVKCYELTVPMLVHALGLKSVPPAVNIVWFSMF